MSEAYERFHSFRRGWQDAAAGRAQNAAFTAHSTPHMREEYEAGYADGVRARREMGERTMNRVGYTPTILRAQGEVI